MNIAAAMQPYFFPYLGYYQLAQAADDFVFLGEANYIVRGYINRNHILLNGAPHRFTLPIVNASQNRSIQDHQYVDSYSPFFALLTQAYKKAPFFDAVIPIVEKCLRNGLNNVAETNSLSIKEVFAYLGMTKRWHDSASIIPKGSLRGQSWIQEICSRLSASRYVNAPGGKDLYDTESFAGKQIELLFLEPVLPPYEQHTGFFVSHLSMIDVLMWNSPERILDMVNAFKVTK